MGSCWRAGVYTFVDVVGGALSIRNRSFNRLTLSRSLREGEKEDDPRGEDDSYPPS